MCIRHWLWLSYERWSGGITLILLLCQVWEYHLLLKLEDRDSSRNNGDFQASEWLSFEALQFGMQHLIHKSLTASFWSCPIWFRLIQESCASKIYSVSCIRLVPKLFAYTFCLIKDKQNFQINRFPKAENYILIQHPSEVSYFQSIEIPRIYQFIDIQD